MFDFIDFCGDILVLGVYLLGLGAVSLIVFILANIIGEAILETKKKPPTKRA